MSGSSRDRAPAVHATAQAPESRAEAPQVASPSHTQIQGSSVNCRRPISAPARSSGDMSGAAFALAVAGRPTPATDPEVSGGDFVSHPEQRKQSGEPAGLRRVDPLDYSACPRNGEYVGISGIS